jgi:hypothetical protein
MTVLGHQDEPFDLGLSNQKPVEWIGVMKRQRFCQVGMARSDGEALKACARQDFQEVVATGQLSGCPLDRDLPDTGRADDNAFSASAIAERALLRSRGSRAVHRIRHGYRAASPRPGSYPNCFNNSGGSGASKSSAIYVRPSKLACLRGSFLATLTGTNLARGWPCLAMMISSPAAARSTNEESWFLAS